MDLILHRHVAIPSGSFEMGAFSILKSFFYLLKIKWIKSLNVLLDKKVNKLHFAKQKS